MRNSPELGVGERGFIAYETFFCSGMNVNDNLGKFAQKFSISCVTELDYICLREVDGRIMQVEMARN